MAGGAQVNPKGSRKKVLVRHPSGRGDPCFRASSTQRTSRSSLGMRDLFAIAILAGSLLTLAQGSLVNLKAVVEAVTGRNAFLAFVGYGCYCGLGGQGLPLDEVDWCCHAHDCCYEKLFHEGCNPYLDHYEYATENDTKIVCSEFNQTACHKQMCECDRSLALCLRSQLYKEEHRNHLNIYCQGPMPNCSMYDPPPEEATEDASPRRLTSLAPSAV